MASGPRTPSRRRRNAGALSREAARFEVCRSFDRGRRRHRRNSSDSTSISFVIASRGIWLFGSSKRMKEIRAGGSKSILTEQDSRLEMRREATPTSSPEEIAEDAKPAFLEPRWKAREAQVRNLRCSQTETEASSSSIACGRK
jgi:hypothetical protein